MSIILKPEQEKFIKQKIQTGQYQDADSVIIEAFQLLENRDQEYQQWLEKTRNKIEIGLQQAKNGQLTDGKIALTQLRQKLAKISEKK